MSREGICHGPLTIMAALPARNWSLTSACVQFRAEEDTEPSFTRSVQSCRACAVSSVSMFFSLPPLDHMTGRNCQVPS
ncbi:hypothetical protein D9M72_498080 [compost metagenome]